ncbi:unnamed protein product, partial [Urochloa humidicola]
PKSELRRGSIDATPPPPTTSSGYVRRPPGFNPELYPAVFVDSAKPCLSRHPFSRCPGMGISRTHVNLLRLLDSAPRQQNQAKLIHYATTSRELLEQLAAENTSEGIT